MCVGKCSRIVGPCLLVLGTLSVLASVLLLFPGGASRYLLQGHLGRHARALPGLWGGGIAVLLAATQVTALGWQCPGCSGRHSAQPGRAVPHPRPAELCVYPLPACAPAGSAVRAALQAGAAGRRRLLRALRRGAEHGPALPAQQHRAGPRARRPLGVPLPGSHRPGGCCQG
ncbi:transmembrane 4 L6 family member 19 isoform 3-T3 [Geothlypis trichas]